MVPLQTGARRRNGFNVRRLRPLTYLAGLIVLTLCVVQLFQLSRINSLDGIKLSPKIPLPPNVRGKNISEVMKVLSLPPVVHEKHRIFLPSAILKNRTRQDRCASRSSAYAGSDVADMWMNTQSVNDMRKSLRRHLQVLEQQRGVEEISEADDRSVPLVFRGHGDVVDVPLHDLARSSMQVDIQLFVVWPAAMPILHRILRDIAKSFLILQIAHFKWSPEEGPSRGPVGGDATEAERFFLEHLWRLYSGKGGLERRDMLTKVYQCGGPNRDGFVAVVVMDPGEEGTVEYSEMPTAHGSDHVSRRMFEKKRLYRKWAQHSDAKDDAAHNELVKALVGGNPKALGGVHSIRQVTTSFRVHGTYTSLEAEHDIRLLFGVTPLDIALRALMPFRDTCPPYSSTADDFIAYMSGSSAINSPLFSRVGKSSGPDVTRGDGALAWVAPLGDVRHGDLSYSPQAAGSETPQLPQIAVRWPSERALMFALSASVASSTGGTETVRCGGPADAPCVPSPSVHPSLISVYVGGGVHPLFNLPKSKRFKLVEELSSSDGQYERCLAARTVFDWRAFDQDYLLVGDDAPALASCIHRVEVLPSMPSHGRFLNVLRIAIADHHTAAKSKPIKKSKQHVDARITTMWNIVAALYATPVRRSQYRCDSIPVNRAGKMLRHDIGAVHQYVSEWYSKGEVAGAGLATSAAELKEQQRRLATLIANVASSTHPEPDMTHSASLSGGDSDDVFGSLPNSTATKSSSLHCVSMWFIAHLKDEPLLVELELNL